MSDSDKLRDETVPPQPAVQFRFDEKLQDSIQTGFGALQQVFAGFAKMAQSVVGPELVRSIQAASWLNSVAECLEAVSSSGCVSGTQAGELVCYSEQLESELTGSKFAKQIPSFSQRLQAAVATAERAMQAQGRISSEDAQTVAAAAGYFRASTKSVISDASENK